MFDRPRLIQPAIIAYVIFAMSGAAGLGWQFAWARMFAFGLGHEAISILAVLTAIFGGIAIGAGALDRRVSESPRPVRWYAWLEFVIAIWGCATVLLIPAVNDAALRWIGLATGSRQWLIAFAIPLFILLPATVAMGASFAAMERFASRCDGERPCVGGLYAANTVGAVLGILGSTFLVLPAIGFQRSLIVFALVNAACGAAALIIESRGKTLANSTQMRSTETPPTSAGSPPSRWRLGVAVFVTGLLGIGFEIVGVRLLAQVLENTVFSYAAVLSIFLVGTAMGAAVYQRVNRRLQFEPTLAALLLALCASLLASAHVFVALPGIHFGIRDVFGDTLPFVVAAELLTAATVFAVPTLLMGATFSHLVQAARHARGGVGRAVALNTIGAALAAPLAGLFLIPRIGMKWSLVLLALGYVTLLPRVRLPHAIGLAVIAMAVALTPRDLRIVELPPGADVVAYRNGVMESVAVVKFPDGNRSLVVNNRFTMGGTGAANAARRHVHLTLLLHPSPRRLLFLGVGTGVSLGAATTHEGLAADGVELVPEITDMLGQFAPENALPHENLRVHVSDARRFVRVAREEYDVIVADLFHPARDGAGALYTSEHFRAMQQRLAPGGLVCQWLPLYQLDEPMLKSIIATFLEVFPNTRAFLLRPNVNTPVIGLIAGRERITYPSDWFERRVTDAALSTALKQVGLTDSYQLLGTFAADADSLRAYSKGASINTDDRPIVMFGAPRFAVQRSATSYGRLFTMLDGTRAPVPALVKADTPRDEQFVGDLELFIRARNLYLRGLAAEAEGRQVEAVETFLTSAAESAHFTTAYAHCLTLATQHARSEPEFARRILERLAQVRPERPIARELLNRLFSKDDAAAPLRP